MSTISHTHTVAEKEEVMAMAVLMLGKLQRASDRGFLLLQVFPLYLGQMALARYMGIASWLPI
jgi:hypothetical protein